jgi:hypothetical protein
MENYLVLYILYFILNTLDLIIDLALKKTKVPLNNHLFL